MVGYEFRKVIDDAGAYCNGDYIQFLEIILKLFDVLPLCEQFRVVEHEWGFSFHTGIPEIAVHCLSGHFESVVICHDYGFLSGKEFFEHVRNLGHTAHSEFHSLRVSCFFKRFFNGNHIFRFFSLLFRDDYIECCKSMFFFVFLLIFLSKAQRNERKCKICD